MDKIKGQAKALLGGMLAGGIALGGYLTTGEGFADVAAGEWVAVGVATLGTYLGVYAIPNRPASRS